MDSEIVNRVTGCQMSRQSVSTITEEDVPSLAK